MVAASLWWPLQHSFEETNAADQANTTPAARNPGPGRQMVHEWEAHLLLTGDVKTNPDPVARNFVDPTHTSDHSDSDLNPRNSVW